MLDWASVVIGVCGGAIAVGVAWAVDKTRWMRRWQQPTIRRTDLTQIVIEPERDGQRVTRNPDSESHRRKTFSTKRRGSTEAHMSQPRKFW